MCRGFEPPEIFLEYDSRWQKHVQNTIICHWNGELSQRTPETVNNGHALHDFVEFTIKYLCPGQYFNAHTLWKLNLRMTWRVLWPGCIPLSTCHQHRDVHIAVESCPDELVTQNVAIPGLIRAIHSSWKQVTPSKPQLGLVDSGAQPCEK